jgi:hypothetical protein
LELTQDAGSLFALVISVLANLFLSYWVVRRDQDAQGRVRLLRSWNEASLLSAIVLVGPLAIWLHFIKSRRSLAGVLLGFGWMLAVTLAVDDLGEGLAWVLGPR